MTTLLFKAVVAGIVLLLVGFGVGVATVHTGSTPTHRVITEATTAPTPTPIPAGIVLTELSGTDGKPHQSAPFSTAGDWQINWKVDSRFGGFFTITVYSTETDLPVMVAIKVWITPGVPQSGIASMTYRGSVYLAGGILGNWQLQAVTA